LPPIVGGIALVGGILLLLTGGKKDWLQAKRFINQIKKGEAKWKY
jgi:hypothetical protein